MTGHLLGMDAFGSQPSKADEDAISLFSDGLSCSTGLSCNTGFTAGTGAFRGQFSDHSKHRMLERRLDDYVIKHTVARGSKSRTKNGRWVFEKDGVVVVASSEDPDLTVVTAWPIEVAFRDTGGLQRAHDAYMALLEALDTAVQEEDRVQALMSVLEVDDVEKSGSISRILHGIDLVRRPRNRPLFHHCAMNGYASCLKVLITAGFLDAAPEVQGSNNCNALHLAAWDGHIDCVKLLCMAAPKLAAQANKWGEFPELAAFNRACEFRLSGQVEPADFEISAVTCLRTRTGSEQLHLDWFQDQALENLSGGLHDRAVALRIAAGTRPNDLVKAVEGLTGRCHAKSFQASFIDLSGESFTHLMRACVRLRFLQALHLTCCGIGVQHLDALRQFLDGEALLEKLSLEGNLLGDRVVDMLSPVLFTVKDVGFDGIGLTSAGLKNLALAMGTASGNSSYRTDAMRLAKNDFSETGGDIPNFTAFMTFLQGPRCTLRSLFLDHTRLQPPQLEALVTTLPKCILSILSCHGLSIPEAWSLSPHGKLFCALSDTRCRLKKLHIDRGNDSRMFDTLWSAVKARDAKLSSELQHGKSKGKGKEIRKGRTDVLPRACLSGPSLDRVFDFTSPFKVSVRAVCWDIKRSAFRADFVTELAGVLSGVVLQPADLNHQDVGKTFIITLRMRRAPIEVDKDQKAKDLVLQSCEPTSGKAPFLEVCRLVLIREASKEVLLLQSRLGPAGQSIHQIMQKIMPELPVGIPAEMNVQLANLLSQLSDFELRGIRESSNSDCFTAPFGRTASTFVNATSAARHHELVSSASWKQFAKLALDEEQARKSKGRTQLHEFHRMLSFRPSCQLQSGSSFSNCMTFDDPQDSFIEQLHRTTLKHPIRVSQKPPDGATPYMDISDSERHVTQRLFPCIVPEELIDDLSLDAPMPWLLPTAHSEPKWVTTTDPQLLKEMLHDDASDGFTSLPEIVCKLARQSDVSRMLRCERL